jgi:predicted branched-subunit amino acid permease
VTTLLSAPTAVAAADHSIRDGVQVTLPFVAGLAPFALAIGAAVAVHGDAVAGWSGSWLIYGGSAHLATLHTLETSGLLVAILAGVLIQTRLLVYSVGLSQRWSHQPIWFRLVAAPLVVDQTWAIIEARTTDRWSPAQERRFFLAVGLTLGIGWSTLIAIGAVASERIDTTHLLVALPICVAALIGPRLRDVSNRPVCVIAAAVALLGAGLPAGTGVLVAIVAGCVVGELLDGSDR